jgi:hypothetical protein
MGESKVFYYETEVEWKKEKEGQIKGPTLPAPGCGGSSRVQRARRAVVPRAALS